MKTLRMRMAVAGLLAVVGCGAAAAAPQMGMHGRMHGMMHPPAQDAPAEAPPAFDQYGCQSCHAIDEDGVGPALAWVAWRYHDAGKDAEAQLTTFIAHGGQGRWSNGPMPDLDVSPADAQQLAHWILSLPPKAPPAGAVASH